MTLPTESDLRIRAEALGELGEPLQLEKIARLRRELDSLSDQQRAELLAKARAARGLAAH